MSAVGLIEMTPARSAQPEASSTRRLTSGGAGGGPDGRGAMSIDSMRLAGRVPVRRVEHPPLSTSSSPGRSLTYLNTRKRAICPIERSQYDHPLRAEVRRPGANTCRSDCFEARNNIARSGSVPSGRPPAAQPLTPNAQSRASTQAGAPAPRRAATRGGAECDPDSDPMAGRPQGEDPPVTVIHGPSFVLTQKRGERRTIDGAKAGTSMSVCGGITIGFRGRTGDSGRGRAWREGKSREAECGRHHVGLPLSSPDTSAPVPDGSGPRRPLCLHRLRLSSR